MIWRHQLGRGVSDNEEATRQRGNDGGPDVADSLRGVRRVAILPTLVPFQGQTLCKKPCERFESKVEYCYTDGRVDEDVEKVERAGIVVRGVCDEV